MVCNDGPDFLMVFHNPQPYQLSLPAATAWQERFAKKSSNRNLGIPWGALGAPAPTKKTSNKTNNGMFFSSVNAEYHHRDFIIEKCKDMSGPSDPAMGS